MPSPLEEGQYDSPVVESHDQVAGRGDEESSSRSSTPSSSPSRSGSKSCDRRSRSRSRVEHKRAKKSRSRSHSPGSKKKKKKSKKKKTKKKKSKKEKTKRRKKSRSRSKSSARKSRSRSSSRSKSRSRSPSLRKKRASRSLSPRKRRSPSSSLPHRGRSPFRRRSRSRSRSPAGVIVKDLRNLPHRGRGRGFVPIGGRGRGYAPFPGRGRPPYRPGGRRSWSRGRSRSRSRSFSPRPKRSRVSRSRSKSRSTPRKEDLIQKSSSAIGESPVAVKQPKPDDIKNQSKAETLSFLEMLNKKKQENREDSSDGKTKSSSDGKPRFVNTFSKIGGSETPDEISKNADIGKETIAAETNKTADGREVAEEPVTGGDVPYPLVELKKSLDSAIPKRVRSPEPFIEMAISVITPSVPIQSTEMYYMNYNDDAEDDSGSEEDGAATPPAPPPPPSPPEMTMFIVEEDFYLPNGQFVPKGTKQVIVHDYPANHPMAEEYRTDILFQKLDLLKKQPDGSFAEDI